ncbi:39S ribosomal protein L12, mitochondrial [Pseudolycoriella hygida]|uniref:39S ribosomal protein L12, mitochondrial n=1 Tax=Pseudolycoriella hygida TaxID=35572 RepID=A0A9Q0NED9_9DIPT|nr:39S ribosomal protein L12, mitochondrial [Pseudolycoriella hygida]
MQCDHTSIEYDDLLRFIERFGDTMKELKIYRTDIHPFHKLSLDDRIKLIPSQLTKLEIVTYSYDKRLIVSMRQLQNIKTLRLEGCILEITDGAVCAPVELHLKHVHFSRNGIDVKKNVVKLNDLFDFRNLKDILVDSSLRKNFELDLSEGALKLNNLVYVNFKAEKWESSKWTVRKLTLYTDTKCTSPTGMLFEELNFHGPALDVEILPTTLRSLEINRFNVKLLHIKAVQNLVNLKYLLLRRTTAQTQGAEKLTIPVPEGADKPANPKLVKIVTDISQLNLLEVSELSSLLKKTLNLPDAPMMPAFAMIKLMKFDDKQKIALIKEVKNLLDGMNLVQAKKFVESAPTLVKENASKEEAEKLKEAFTKVGAVIEIE